MCVSTCYCRSGGGVCATLFHCVCVRVCVYVECIQVLYSFVNDCYFFISTK